MAFLVEGDDVTAAMDYLNGRESQLGGYKLDVLPFTPREGPPVPFEVLVYIATPDNKDYLGPVPLPDLALQIATSRGAWGHNAEYVFRLAEFMRLQAPEVMDQHLTTLELYVRLLLQVFGVDVNSVYRESTESSKDSVTNDVIIPPTNQLIPRHFNDYVDVYPSYQICTLPDPRLPFTPALFPVPDIDSKTKFQERSKNLIFTKTILNSGPNIRKFPKLTGTALLPFSKSVRSGTNSKRLESPVAKRNKHYVSVHRSDLRYKVNTKPHMRHPWPDNPTFFEESNGFLLTA